MAQPTIKARKAKVYSYEGTLTLQFIGGIGFLGVMALPGFIESFPWPF